MTPSGIEPATFRFVAQHLDETFYRPKMPETSDNARCNVRVRDALPVLLTEGLWKLSAISITN